MATTTTMTFIYKGTDRKGKTVQGEVQGKSSALVKAQLLKQGIRIKTVRKKPKPLFGSDKKAIKPLDIAIFTRQMATMMKAGVPLVQSFDLVADGVENKTLRWYGDEGTKIRSCLPDINVIWISHIKGMSSLPRTEWYMAPPRPT